MPLHGREPVQRSRPAATAAALPLLLAAVASAIAASLRWPGEDNHRGPSLTRRAVEARADWQAARDALEAAQATADADPGSDRLARLVGVAIAREEGQREHYRAELALLMAEMARGGTRPEGGG